MPPIDPTSQAIGSLTAEMRLMRTAIDKMQLTLDGLVATENQNAGKAKLRASLFGIVGGLGGTIITMIAGQFGIRLPGH